MEYYQLPFSAMNLFKTKELQKCNNLKDSIGQNIDLILETSYGESAYDPNFGCSIWEHDFECIYNTDQWNSKLGQSIQKSIQQYEPRLNNVIVNTQIVEDEIQQIYNNNVTKRIKRRIDVKIRGNYATTNEVFEGIQRLYISPMSMD